MSIDPLLEREPEGPIQSSKRGRCTDTKTNRQQARKIQQQKASSSNFQQPLGLQKPFSFGSPSTQIRAWGPMGCSDSPLLRVEPTGAAAVMLPIGNVEYHRSDKKSIGVRVKIAKYY